MDKQNLFTKCSLHEIAPYVGRLSPEKANTLIREYTRPGFTVLDPFVGSGIVTLEAALSGCRAIGSDVNPYSIAQTKAKLFFPPTQKKASSALEVIRKEVEEGRVQLTAARIPKWVKSFFHPRTLKETLSYAQGFRARDQHLHLACLLGILHHQRPGFLSFPSSHSTPYLRDKKFPKNQFPELYEYRDVHSRLEKKIIRTYKRIPSDFERLGHRVVFSDIRDLSLRKESVDVCITSPPYMDNLAYGRDNRLRLWLLGVNDWQALDKTGYRNLTDFRLLMSTFFIKMKLFLKPRSLCVVVLGESRGKSIESFVVEAAKQSSFSLIHKTIDRIPDAKRIRKGYNGTKRESVMVFQKVA